MERWIDRMMDGWTEQQNERIKRTIDRLMDRQIEGTEEFIDRSTEIDGQNDRKKKQQINRWMDAWNKRIKKDQQTLDRWRYRTIEQK